MVTARRRRAGARHPDPEQRQQKVEIDRLGDVVGSAGLEAFLAIALHRLGGDRDQRNVGDRRPAAYLAHRLVAVHLRHHDVDQRHVDIWYLLEDGDAVPAPLGMQHLDVVGLQHAGQRIDVADVVIDDQHLGARQVGGIETLGRLGRTALRLLAGQHGRHQQRQLRQVFRTRHVGDRRVERQRMIERLESRREDQQSGSGTAKPLVDPGQRLRIVLCRASEAEHDRVVGGEFVRTGVGGQARR